MRASGPVCVVECGVPGCAAALLIVRGWLYPAGCCHRLNAFIRQSNNNNTFVPPPFTCITVRPSFSQEVAQLKGRAKKNKEFGFGSSRFVAS